MHFVSFNFNYLKHTLICHFCHLHTGVMASVYQLIFWSEMPLQSIADAHVAGRDAGKKIGTYLHSMLNFHLSIKTDFVAGKTLDTIQKDICSFIQETQKLNKPKVTATALFLCSHVTVLQEGLSALDEENENALQAKQEYGTEFPHSATAIASKALKLVRMVLFQQLDEVSIDMVNISEMIHESSHVLRPLLIFGIFFEGLASYLISRKGRSKGGREKWMKNGDLVLAQMKLWSEHSKWNWENKANLLEAEVRS